MTKTIKKGFTIVELLIVIVVIGILAGIVVVTYNGVQNKTKTTAAEAVAKEIRDKAEAFSAEVSTYPTFAQLKTASINPTDANTAGTELVNVAKLSTKTKAAIVTSDATIDTNAITNKAGWNDSSKPKNKEKVSYIQCTTGSGSNLKVTGAAIYFYDYETQDVTTKPMVAGECPTMPTTYNG